MLLISATDEWRTTHHGAMIGLLELSNVENDHTSLQLDQRKRETESRLRERYKGFTRQDFLSLPVMSAYEQYYKKFNKTYHVQLQVESIVLKGKSLPNVSPLVDSNFIAEVETLVLTAGHDVAKLHGIVIALKAPHSWASGCLPKEFRIWISYRPCNPAPRLPLPFSGSQNSTCR